MAVIEKNSMPFKPYARLMNLLGDQLITNKIVAVIEILKNCYDADSPTAEVRFKNLSNIGFDESVVDNPAYIEIKDAGCGMSLDIIKNVWFRPATPAKYDKKKNSKEQTLRTPKGRIIQGEKGIGRFAIHKLGDKIEVYTKAKGEKEVKVEMNFSDFDPDSADLFSTTPTHKLLEDVQNTWYVNDPAEEITGESGTIIRIYNLREKWDETDFDSLYKNIQRLMPPDDEGAEKLRINIKKDFEVNMYVEDVLFTSKGAITFSDIIERAQYKMIGTIDAAGNLNFEYKSQSPTHKFSRTLNLMDNREVINSGYDLYGLKWFARKNRYPECGEFCFSLYAFDLQTKDKTILTVETKKFLKENFVYVLRDGVRVYPFGEQGIDWLNLDKLRSTLKAGRFISYNDLTGFIYISQEKNPKLKDASNRQGIINLNGAFDDFTNLVISITEIFNTEIKIDKNKSEIKKAKLLSKTKNALTISYEELKKSLDKLQDLKTLSLANKFVNTYQEHLSVIEDRMQTVEDLAGLGMAVEKSSHDNLRLLSLMKSNILNMKERILKSNVSKDEFIDLMNDLTESITLITEDIQLIQPLFKLQRKSIKDVSIKESLRKVLRYFRYEINDKIETNIDELESDFKISTNEGIILQILINLIDNAIYWLNSSEIRNKKIYFKINPVYKSIIIADNGSGIREDIIPLIFNEFVSMKSQGRGLGLYIVRELLYRINSEIFVIDNDKNKILSGANFIINFNNEEN